MSTWKKILVEGDAVTNNLATANLSQADSVRSYDLNGNTNRVAFKDGIVQFSNSSNSVSHQFDNVNGVFDARSASGIRLSDGDNGQYLDLKPKSEISASYTITFPNAAPGAANKILESDASGNLTWIDTPSGGGGVTINNNTNNYLVTASGTANTLNGESNLTYSTDLSITSGSLHLNTNNKYLTGKIAATGATRNIIGIDTGDSIVVGNPTANKVTLTGVVTADSGIKHILSSTASISAAGDYGVGSEVFYNGNTTTTAGQIYYLSSSGWVLADADAESTASGLLGVAIGTNSGTDGMVLRGMVYLSAQGSPVSGDKVFLSTTAGGATGIAPTTAGDIQRVLGYVTGNGIVYFNPSVEYIEIA